MLLLLIAQAAFSVVIDDFSVGFVALRTEGTFDEQSATDSGLDESHVLGGVRRLTLREGRPGPDTSEDAHISMGVALDRPESRDGVLYYEAQEGLTGINTYVEINGNPDSQDLGQSLLSADVGLNGENAIMIRFEFTEFMDPSLPDVGFLDVTFLSRTTGIGSFVALPNSDQPFAVYFPGLDHPGSTFDLGRFSGYRLGTSNGNLRGSFEISTIETVVFRPGDFNGDGEVDSGDYLLWREHFGKEYNLYNGAFQFGPDGNGDGKVDAADFTIWRDSYVQSSSAQLLPEPATALLLAIAAGAASVARRRC